eukprot:465555-Hanusia_phi.AAC.1
MSRTVSATREKQKETAIFNPNSGNAAAYHPAEDRGPSPAAPLLLKPTPDPPGPSPKDSESHGPVPGGKP